MGISGQLVADPDSAKPGVGALLLRSLHGRAAGRDDHRRRDGRASATCGARSEGTASPAASIGWTVVFAPATFGSALAERRLGATAALRAAAPIAHAVDSVAGRELRPTRPDGRTDLLTPELFAEQLPS